MLNFLKQIVDSLNRKIEDLTCENRLLKDDNARLRSIINNDSSNSSLPPSTDQKGGKPANTYNGRTKTGRKAGGQKGRKGTTLTKADIEEKIRSGKCRHEIRTIGIPSTKKYVTKYVVDLKAETVVYHAMSSKSIDSLRETGNKWSDEMISLLCDMNTTRKQLIEQEISGFSEEELKEYEQKYQNLLIKGRSENKNTSHKYAKSDEKTLLNRMEKYIHNHLLFLYDFSVPFDNNISERDLRKAKNRQKMAGGFRKESGHQMYCSVLTILETLKRRNMGIIENIKQLFMGTPAIF